MTTTGTSGLTYQQKLRRARAREEAAFLAAEDLEDAVSDGRAQIQDHLAARIAWRFAKRDRLRIEEMAK